MNPDLFRGSLVHLAAANAETDADLWAGWGRDSEFLRLLDSDPAKPWSRQQTRKELEEEPKPHAFPFVIPILNPVLDRLHFGRKLLAPVMVNIAVKCQKPR